MCTNELKSTKAIALIALVISILVLLILAGVSIGLLVGENGITGRAVTAKKTYDITGAKEKLELDVSNYAIEFYQAKYTNGGSSPSGTIGSYVLGKFTNNSDFEEDYTLTKEDNKITITNKKDASQKATATIDENGKVSWSGNNDNQTQKQWDILTDYGNDGLSIGDLVHSTIEGVASEQFYVINVENGVVTLLAEKNVKTNDETPANNVQSSSANELAFDSSANLFANSSIKGEVDKYVGILTVAGLTLEDVEINPDTHATAKGRLMWGTETSGELKALLDANLTDLVFGPSGAKLNYWLGSPKENATTDAWFVAGNWREYYNYKFSYSWRFIWASTSYRSITVKFLKKR